MNDLTFCLIETRFFFLRLLSLPTRYISHVGVDHFTFKGKGFWKKISCKQTCPHTIHAHDHFRMSRKSVLHRQKIHACTVLEKNISKCMKRLYHPLPLPPQKSDVPPLGDLTETPFVASPSLMTLFLFYWPTRYVGDDCQSLLRTRECLFTFFVFTHVRRHKK